MREVIKTKKDTNDQLEETRTGLMETFELTGTNTTDISDLREAVMEIYELIEGGEE